MSHNIPLSVPEDDAENVRDFYSEQLGRDITVDKAMDELKEDLKVEIQEKSSKGESLEHKT